MGLKVEIGPRWRKIAPDWVTVDIVPRHYVDRVADWAAGLPFADGSVSLIYASHVLEHIWWYRTDAALREAYRVLAPGGLLELHVPDLAAILLAYVRRSCLDDWRAHNPEGDPMKWINGRIFAHDDRGEGDQHWAIFDRAYLRRCLQKAGFGEMIDAAPVRSDSRHPSFDLAMTAVKP